MADLDSSPKGDILLVDDSPTNLRLLMTLLEARGYEVRGVLSGRMALMAAQAAPPDLILLDITMPQMDGYQVCRHLREDPRTQEIPVIFVSGLNEALDKVQAFQVGGVDYITKPFQFEEVLARIEHQLIILRLRRQLMEQNQRMQREIEERKRVEAAVQKANQELERLAYLDGLTQVSNRRRFDSYLQQEWERSKQDQTPLSLILIDVDYFKRYNDTYGHQAGDDCLIQIAQTVQGAVEGSRDLVARYGGEEFAVILPQGSQERAYQVARQIQSLVQELGLPHRQSKVSPIVTLSLGIATLLPRSTFSADELIAEADAAIYEAKARGRNRIVEGWALAAISD